MSTCFILCFNFFPPCNYPAPILTKWHARDHSVYIMQVLFTIDWQVKLILIFPHFKLVNFVYEGPEYCLSLEKYDMEMKMCKNHTLNKNVWLTAVVTAISVHSEILNAWKWGIQTQFKEESDELRDKLRSPVSIFSPLTHTKLFQRAQKMKPFNSELCSHTHPECEVEGVGSFFKAKQTLELFRLSK